MKSEKTRFVLRALAFFLCLLTISCGGGGRPVSPPPTSVISISVSPASATVQAGATQQFTATVTGTSNTAVTWSVNDIQGGNSTVGTISTSGLYTAPANLPSPNTVTVKATSVTDSTKSASATATIAAPSVMVTVSPTSATVHTGGTQQFTATVSGGSNTTVSWSVNGVAGGDPTVGMISTTGVYTAPTTVPNPNTVTISATPVADATKSGSATVAVTSNFNQLSGASNFPGPYPPPGPVSYTDSSGLNQTVTAFPGQVEVIVSTSTTASAATALFQANNGTIIAQLPTVGMYWVQVAAGSEASFINAIKGNPAVSRAFPSVALTLAQTGPVIDLGNVPQVTLATPLAVSGDVGLLDHFSGSVPGCPNNVSHGACVGLITTSTSPGDPPLTFSGFEAGFIPLTSLIASPNTIAFQLERIALGAKDAGELKVLNLSLQGQGPNDLVDRHMSCDTTCATARQNEAAFLETIFVAVERMDASLRSNLAIFVAAGNNGLDLTAETQFLKAFTPNALKNIQLVGGLDQSGVPDAGLNSSQDPLTILYAPETNVSTSAGTVIPPATGTSLAAPQFARLAAQVHKVLPTFTGDQIVDAIRKAAGRGGQPASFLPNGYNTIPSLSGVLRVVGPPPPSNFTLSVSKAGTGSGTVTSSPAGINCGAACSASFPSGTAVTLTAIPDPGSTFSSWGGAGCSGAGTCTVTVSSSQNVTASFNAGGPQLMIPPFQGLGGSINAACPGGSVVDPITLIAFGGSPLSGYTWTVSPGFSFPAGTTVEPLTGIFRSTGGALVAGTHTFSMTVSDGSKTATGMFTFAVSVDTSGICGHAIFEQSHLATITLPNAKAGAGYGASLFADGDGVLPWTWSHATGSLPPGLVIDASRGVVRGTPFSSAAGQTFSFTINVVDSTGKAAICPCATYAISVN